MTARHGCTEKRPHHGWLVGKWWLVYPSDGGFGTECGPFLTRWGARLHRRLWG